MQEGKISCKQKNDNQKQTFFIQLKLKVFKGIGCNSLILIMLVCEAFLHGRFITKYLLSNPLKEVEVVETPKSQNRKDVDFQE
jgi:hypothetical protein